MDFERFLPAGEVVTATTHLSQLWAGYGHIYRLRTETGKSYVLKNVASPPIPRGQPIDEGHVRKLLSYRIESNFYRSFGMEAGKVAAVPAAVFVSDHNIEDTIRTGDEGEALVIVLEDISIEFPVMGEQRELLNSDAQVRAVVQWLANFHARFWNVESRYDTQSWCPAPLVANRQQWTGNGLWRQGGYSYLATRMDELRSMVTQSTKTLHSTICWDSLGLNAEHDLPYAVEWALSNPLDHRRLTLVHGDVKAANMAFTREHSSAPEQVETTAVAMYDFQYVGVGLGVQDLVMLAASSIDPTRYLMNGGEQRLLRQYHAHLCRIDPEIELTYPFHDLFKDWELALVSWVRFLAGWSGGFWGNVSWLQTRVHGLLQEEQWRTGIVTRWREEGRRSYQGV